MRLTNCQTKAFAALAAGLMLSLVPLKAQESEEKCGPSLTRADFETRLGYAYDTGAKGFQADFINVRLDAQLAKGLSFSYRQRLNRITTSSFIESTDWLHLDWQATPWLTLAGGKQVVAIGGYEYDRAPIDLYYCSEVWNNVACYQFGASATFSLAEKDALTFQVCQSPFRKVIGNDSYALNLLWSGSHGFWETLWSVNMLQIQGPDFQTDQFGKWMNYVALGNRFHIASWLQLELDWLNRYALGQKGGFFSDWSLMAELSAKLGDKFTVFGKYTRDDNNSQTAADYLSSDGTKLNLASAGVEYQPLGAVRVFLAGAYVSGVNTNPAGVLADGQLMFEAGLKWRLDFLSLKKKN